MTTIPSADADNPLIVGQAIHTGIEKGLEKALEEYYASFNIITNEQINEAIKLEYLIPKARDLLPKGAFEVEIADDDFWGFIDLLVPVDEAASMFDIYDFKYSNNIKHYLESRQLHVYKYYFEKRNPGCSIRNLYFAFIPKVNIKQKKTEDLSEFRKRIENELQDTEIKIMRVDYDYQQVVDYLTSIKHILEERIFNKEPCYLCRYCDFEDYCMKGNDYMLLPSNERRKLEGVNKRVIWIYGVPFCGKTTFANNFPDPLMLNTDGNIKFVDAPYIHIKDDVRVEGRVTRKTLAWSVFKDIVDELEKKQNDFKTIVVDLLEDLYEACRVYMCNEMGITHESDDSFKAWDKVRSEFLNTLKRLVNLDYENIILISHEDTTKDITKKGGDKVTAIKPNIAEKVANKVAGMVDVVARIVADGDVRSFCFKSNEVIFGGGRLKVQAKDISLDVMALFRVYDDANKAAISGRLVSRESEEKQPKAADAPQNETSSEPPRRSRARRTQEVEEAQGETHSEPDKSEMPVESAGKPATRTRKKRS